MTVTVTVTETVTVLRGNSVWVCVRRKAYGGQGMVRKHWREGYRLLRYYGRKYCIMIMNDVL